MGAGCLWSRQSGLSAVRLPLSAQAGGAGCSVWAATNCSSLPARLWCPADTSCCHHTLSTSCAQPTQALLVRSLQQPRGYPRSAEVETWPSFVTCPGPPSKGVNEPDLPLKLSSHGGPRVAASTLLPQQVPDGFISHFYSVSEHVSPVLAFGFLGPKPQLAEVCTFFKVSRECCGHCSFLGPACHGPWGWVQSGVRASACSSRKGQWVPGESCAPFHWEPAQWV